MNIMSKYIREQKRYSKYQLKKVFNLNNEEHNVQFSHVNKGSINYYNK